jgi:hypothetical protein
VSDQVYDDDDDDDDDGLYNGVVYRRMSFYEPVTVQFMSSLTQIVAYNYKTVLYL